MKLFLAPMEGITDFVMRDLLTSVGGIDQCVTEFLRVTNRLHPHSVFLKNCPELKMGSKTRSGTPVFLQLLGGQAGPLAENAARAAELGACGIDLNFGCPAKTVNRHDGGATLLQTPQRLFDIVTAVRKAVPAGIPVSAKMRLGFQDTSLVIENAKALNEARASFITVHCRTKIQGYRPPAHWEFVPMIQEQVQIPVVANGDIQSLATWSKCKSITGAEQFMIGRSALTSPRLFQQIRNSHGVDQSLGNEVNAPTWSEVKNLLPTFFEASEAYINSHFATSRTKQWMKALSMTHPEAKAVFDEIKVLKTQAFQKGLEKFCC